MSDFWLRCDACNKDLKAEADQEMQLCLRFKPSLMRRMLDPLHPQQQLHRCRSCGWVNVFVPAVVPDASLTHRWRDAIVVK